MLHKEFVQLLPWFLSAMWLKEGKGCLGPSNALVNEKLVYKLYHAQITHFSPNSGHFIFHILKSTSWLCIVIIQIRSPVAVKVQPNRICGINKL